MNLLALVLLAGSPIAWWTTHALDKVRPNDAMPAAPLHSVNLSAAQNEFEPFQIVLRGEADGVDVTLTDLTGPAATISANDYVTVYFESYINIATPSSLEGAAGEWPDALIPRVDRYARQKRNAFPMHLTAGRNQAIWVEVYVPLGTPAGDYQGKVQISVHGEPYAEAPVTLHVWDFALPSTSSLKTSFGFNGGIALKAHYGSYTSDADLYRLTRMYTKSLLWHRLSTYGGSMVPPRMFGDKIDWKNYDAEVAPFLDGTIMSGKDPLPGAAATTANLRIPPQLPRAEERPYFPQWIRHFADHGWTDRLFYYLWDEPPTAVFPKLVDKGQAAHHADGGVLNLVTIAVNNDMRGIVDIWVPLINCMENKPGFDPFCQQNAKRSDYQSELNGGKKLWWYQSCASHGCNIVGGEYFRGWPSYMIDTPPVGNRIFQWLAWKYGVEGELYFNTDQAYNDVKDPWENVHLFGGNGDGTLFYPGRVKRIGGSTDIPIESIRLKLIREGLEDYEYLALCRKAGLQDVARNSVNAVATNLYQWDHNPADLYAARRRMGEALSSKSPKALAGNSRQE